MIEMIFLARRQISLVNYRQDRIRQHNIMMEALEERARDMRRRKYVWDKSYCLQQNRKFLGNLSDMYKKK